MSPKKPRGQKADLFKWANDQQQLAMRTKAILKELCAFADAECVTWSPVATLAYAANCNERTVQYHLRKLEAEGLLEPTGGTHRLEDSSRSVPLYRLAPHVEGLGLRDGSAPPPMVAKGEGGDASMGAKVAPIEPGYGCKSTSSMGAIGLHPHKENLGEPEEADASSERASQIDLDQVFAAVEAAYPRLGLGFTDRAAAWAALVRLAAEGVDVAALPAAAARYAADPILKKRDFGPVGLQRWLGEGRYRGWLEAAPLAAEPGVAAAVAEAALPADVAEVFAGKTAPWRASWLSGAVWRQADRTLALRTGMAVTTVERELGPALRAAGITLTRAPPGGTPPPSRAPSVANAPHASSPQDPS